jgi:hypothetical protein
MGKRCLQSRPRGPAPKISPARKGWVHRQAVERRRCGTTFFVCYRAFEYPLTPLLFNFEQATSILDTSPPACSTNSCVFNRLRYSQCGAQNAYHLNGPSRLANQRRCDPNAG